MALFMLSCKLAIYAVNRIYNDAINETKKKAQLILHLVINLLILQQFSFYLPSLFIVKQYSQTINLLTDIIAISKHQGWISASHF